VIGRLSVLKIIPTHRVLPLADSVLSANRQLQILNQLLHLVRLPQYKISRTRDCNKQELLVSSLDYFYLGRGLISGHFLLIQICIGFGRDWNGHTFYMELYYLIRIPKRVPQSFLCYALTSRLEPCPQCRLNLTYEILED
jgi:hypothetical protein